LTVANLRICARNIIDTATMSASPALVTTLPETNLQTQQRFKTARSTSTAAQDAKASWASAQRCNFVHTRMHNFTAAAQKRVRNYTDSAFTTGLIDNAAADCFAYTGFSRNDVFTEADFRLLKNSTRYFTLMSTLQSMNITYTDAANPDGYFDISRIFAGEYFEFAYQVPFGGDALTFEDFGTQTRMDDGSLVTDKGPKARKLDLSAEFCSAADWAELLALLRYAGKDKDIFVSLYPGDGTYLEAYWQGLYKLADVGAFSRYFPTLARSKLTLIET
jgi:hypothetical protein